MFETMRLHGLGTEEATRALIVSKAFQRQAEGSSMSMVQAIESLASNISVNNLLYESDYSSMDVASDDDEESWTVRSDLRVNPVANFNTQQQQQQTSKTETSLSGRKRKINEAASGQDSERAHKKATKQDTSKPLGKRKVDATITNEKPTSRPRADSVTEVVDAKITAILPAATTTATSRPKRHLRSGSPENVLLSEGGGCHRNNCESYRAARVKSNVII